MQHSLISMGILSAYAGAEFAPPYLDFLPSHSLQSIQGMNHNLVNTSEFPKKGILLSFQETFGKIFVNLAKLLLLLFSHVNPRKVLKITHIPLV